MKENPKHTDHHFTKISEYKYTLEFVEPRKSYEELQKENEALNSLIENLINTVGFVCTNHNKIKQKLERIKQIFD